MKRKIYLFGFICLLAIGNAQTAYKDVAPIFYAHCTTCHNQYGHFPLLSYSNVVANAGLMSHDLQNDIMPPWPPDTTYSRFIHERLMSSADRSTLVNWLSAGMYAGDTTLAPPAPVYTRYKLTGTPSLIVQGPAFVSNASTTDSYVCFSIPINLTQDQIVRAYEVVPSNPAIVHHVIVNVDTVGNTSSDLSGTCYTAPGSFSMGGYAPGAEPTVLPGLAPLKMGMKLKAGSKIVLQVHFPTGTAGHTDSTQLRLFFYPTGATGIRSVMVKTPLQNWSMMMPANAVTNYTAQYPGGSTPIPIDLSMFAAFPHSHKVCTSLYNYASNGSSTINLIRINKWLFNWQGYYTYRNLVRIPAGYQLHSNHTYDNTTNNINNPFSPPQTVYAGTNTTDEMLFDSYMYLYYQAGDENINIDSLLQNDTLLMAGIRPATNYGSNVKVSCFPNPFSDKVRLSYSLDYTTSVKVAVYDLFGRQVAVLFSGREEPGMQYHDWIPNTSEGAPSTGMYLYKITIGSSQHTGKLIFRARN